MEKVEGLRFPENLVNVLDWEKDMWSKQSQFKLHSNTGYGFGEKVPFKTILLSNSDTVPLTLKHKIKDEGR